MNRNQLRCLMAVFAFILFTSCKTKQVIVDDPFPPAYAKIHKTPSTTLSSPKGGPQFTGREVQPAFAFPCFKRYAAIMNDHAFVTNPSGKVTLTMNEEMITTAVSYDGEKMVEWMQRMLKAFPGTEPKDVGFLMMPGHLDEQFLKDVGEEPSDWQYKLNRISIFIVPVKKSDADKFKQLIRNRGNNSALSAFFQGGPPFWELGGVQP